MEIVNPDGSKMEVKKEEVVKQEVPSEEKKQEEAPPVPLSCNIDSKGIMHIDVNLAACVHSEDMFCMMRGFLDSKRDEAMANVMRARVELAKQQASILKAGPKWPFGIFGKRR